MDGPEGLARAAAADGYDMALVVRTSQPLQDVHRRLVLRHGRGDRDGRDPRTGAITTTPRWTSCSSRPPASSIPRPARLSYGQIDDQLWSQMVALPLFGEPALVANGVQMANVQYNAGDGLGSSGISSTWTALKPGSARRRPG